MDDSPEAMNELLYGQPETPIDRPLADEAEAAETLRLIVVLQAQRDMVAAAFDAELSRVANRKKEILAGLDAAIEERAEQMRAWHAALVARSGAAKTIHLPTGVSKIRKAGPVLDVHDPAALRSWARDRPDPETGQVLEERLWPSRPRRDDELLKKELAAFAGLEDGEAGVPAPLMVGGWRVPGVTVLRPGNKWTGGQG